MVNKSTGSCAFCSWNGRVSFSQLGDHGNERPRSIFHQPLDGLGRRGANLELDRGIPLADALVPMCVPRSFCFGLYVFARSDPFLH